MNLHNLIKAVRACFFSRKAISLCLLVIGGALFSPLPALSASVCPERGSFTPPATINIDPTLPVGSILYSTNIVFSDPDRCASDGPIARGSIEGIGIPDGINYPTGIPGVAYNAGISYWGYAPTSWSTGGVPRAYFFGGGDILMFRLVKTGPIMPGVFPAGPIMNGKGDAKIMFQLTMLSSVIVAPAVPACTADSVVPVGLEPIMTNNLASQGSTGGDKNFSINIHCSMATNLSLSFNGDAVDKSNGVLRNTDATTGSSVGIQILKEGAIVPIDPANIIPLGLINGDYSALFTARYYALNNTVVEGNVNAIAFATIVYN